MSAAKLAKKIKSDLIGRKRSFGENDSFSGILRLIRKEGSHDWHPAYIQFVSAIKSGRVWGCIDMVLTRWYSAQEVLNVFAELVTMGCESQDEFARALNAREDFYLEECRRLKYNPYRD